VAINDLLVSTADVEVFGEWVVRAAGEGDGRLAVRAVGFGGCLGDTGGEAVFVLEDATGHRSRTEDLLGLVGRALSLDGENPPIPAVI
jgi:hypothetical protein